MRWAFVRFIHRCDIVTTYQVVKKWWSFWWITNKSQPVNIWSCSISCQWRKVCEVIELAVRLRTEQYFERSVEAQHGPGATYSLAGRVISQSWSLSSGSMWILQVHHPSLLVLLWRKIPIRDKRVRTPSIDIIIKKKQEQVTSLVLFNSIPLIPLFSS